MAKSHFVRKTIRHPVTIGVIVTVIGTLLAEAMRRWLGYWPPIFATTLSWGLGVIDQISFWVWAVGGLVAAFVLGGFLGVFVHRLLITRSREATGRNRRCNLIGITTPIVRLDGRHLEGCVAYNLLESTDPVHHRSQWSTPDRVYEVVVAADSPDVQLLKSLAPIRVSGTGSEGYRPEQTCEVRDIDGTIGHMFEGGQCIGVREYPSGNLAFLFKFRVERII